MTFEMRSLFLRPAAGIARTARRYTGFGLPEARPVFIHIPKTAGRAVGRMLKVAYWGHPTLWVQPEMLQMPQRELERYSVFRGHIPPSFAERVPNPFAFTFLRDPEDLAVSLYYFVRSRGLEIPSLGKFLEGEDADNLITRSLVGEADAGAAIEVLSRMNFIGLTERFNEDTQRLFGQLGRRSVEPIKWKATHARLALDDLSSSVRSALRERTAADRQVYDWALKQRQSLVD